MKKKRNKGITLVELIISVALVSLIMVFLFKLLVDVKYIDENRTYADLNQINKATIIKEIQNDFMDKTLQSLQDVSTSTKASIRFTFTDGTVKILDVLEDTIAYGDSTWKIKGRNKSTKYVKSCLPFFVTMGSSINSDYYSIRLVIPVTVGSTTSDFLDDIEISYVGKVSDLITPLPSKAYLGYNTTNCSN